MIQRTSVPECCAQSMTVCLVDAAGVLYTDSGCIPGASHALHFIKDQQCPIMLVTNNSGMNPADIARKCQESQFPIDSAHIMSSGLGLSLDPTIRARIHGQSVFVYGTESSYVYIERAGGTVVENIQASTVIVMTSSFKTNHDRIYNQVKRHVMQHPDIPVICANPDRYVQHHNQQHPVIGFYAQQLANDTGVSIHWIGKPHANFAQVLSRWLRDQHGIVVGPHCYFFDDNMSNVVQLQQQLNVTGCCVKNTGLSKALSWDNIHHDYPLLPHYYIPQFSLPNDT